MKEWEKTLVSQSSSILSVIKTIDASALQIALVVDENNRLAGTVTDGDIRRAILKGISLEQPVELILNRNPVVARDYQSRDEILGIMKRKSIHHVPVVNSEGEVTKLEMLDEILSYTGKTDNLVVIMAGGLGTRLRPLTEERPKPLIEVGGRPILETIIRNFAEQGFKKFYVALNYKAEQIKEYFEDGSKWDVEINYIYEQERMGTAGALGLLPEKPDRPFLVMNADLLTSVNFHHLLDYHLEQKATATMCIREYVFQLPYGRVEIDDDRLVGISEKPVHKFFVNAGIYVLEPEALKYISANSYFDMTTLFEKIIQDDLKTGVFPIREYWLDIGYSDDIKKANKEYGDVFINDKQ